MDDFNNEFIEKISLKRINTTKEKFSHNRSQDLHEYLYDHVFDLDTIGIFESFHALFLDTGNNVIAHALISQGGVTKTHVDPKILFTYALLSSCSRLALAHNHPSNRQKPSNEDENLTRNLKELARLFHIQINDHIIVCPDRTIYYSFADNGLL